MVASTRPRDGIILSAGGALHGILVWQSVMGLSYMGFHLYAAEKSRIHGFESSPLPDFVLWQAAYLIAAVPFGWFCYRLAGVTHPWRSERRSLLVTAPVSAVLGLSFGFAGYAVRGDYAAAPSWYALFNACVVAGVVLAGAVSFYRIGTRESREASAQVVLEQ
ncbi:hypothetical protein [Agromyces sp. Soil535]|uniref:hypothetical protein n=1 Tax=Agromyces sp. Soil535 TaxID=1736390 RepID=UPI000AF2FC31|nr:hypothetical protein [Agromyces sp. Soil535]